MTMSYSIKAGWILWEKFDVSDGKTFFFAILFIIALALVTEILSYSIWMMNQSNKNAEKTGEKPMGGKLSVGFLYFLLRLLNYS